MNIPFNNIRLGGAFWWRGRLHVRAKVDNDPGYAVSMSTGKVFPISLKTKVRAAQLYTSNGLKSV